MAQTTTFPGAPWIPVSASGVAEAGAEASASAGYVRLGAGTAVCTATVSLVSRASVNFTGTGALVVTADGAIYEPLPVEVRLRKPFPYPALEECRQRALQAVTGSRDVVVQARTVLTMAYSTELKSAFVHLLDTPAEKVLTTLPGKNKAVDIDQDIHILTLRYPQVFRELRQMRLPHAYQDLIEKRLTSASFNHRVSAMCAMLVLVAALLLDDEANT